MEKLLHERLRESANHCDDGIYIGDSFIGPLYISEMEALADELERYYIPRPRFEDGEPVQFEDAFSVPNITPDRRCKGIVYLVDGSYKLVDGMLESYRFDDCSRPTPKVYDADGVEIKRNDRMYPIEKKCNSDTEGYIVNHIEVDDGINSPRVYFLDDVGMSWMKADQLTHERPVFDAEGVRICKGDTVWIVKEGYRCNVTDVLENGRIDVDVFFNDETHRGEGCAPELFTHREPDSRSKVECELPHEIIGRIDKLVKQGRWLNG